MSLINKINKSGPSMDPCDTPAVTVALYDGHPPKDYAVTGQLSMN